MSELTIDHSPALGDIVIWISQEELVRLTMLMYGQRTGSFSTAMTPNPSPPASSTACVRSTRTRVSPR